MSQQEKNYRLITGPDDDHFCDRVSDARREGWELHGSPAMAFYGEHVIVGQAVVRITEESVL